MPSFTEHFELHKASPSPNMRNRKVQPDRYRASTGADTNRMSIICLEYTAAKCKRGWDIESRACVCAREIDVYTVHNVAAGFMRNIFSRSGNEIPMRTKGESAVTISGRMRRARAISATRFGVIRFVPTEGKE